VPREWIAQCARALLAYTYGANFNRITFSTAVDTWVDTMVYTTTPCGAQHSRCIEVYAYCSSAVVLFCACTKFSNTAVHMRAPCQAHGGLVPRREYMVLTTSTASDSKVLLAILLLAHRRILCMLNFTEKIGQNRGFPGLFKIKAL
jgi:hypothetical protein